MTEPDKSSGRAESKSLVDEIAVSESVLRESRLENLISQTHDIHSTVYYQECIMSLFVEFSTIIHYSHLGQTLYKRQRPPYQHVYCSETPGPLYICVHIIYTCS